jgi:hypothetical protein
MACDESALTQLARRRGRVTSELVEAEVPESVGNVLHSRLVPREERPDAEGRSRHLAHGESGSARRDGELTRLACIRAEVTGESVERAREVLAGAGRTRDMEQAPLGEAHVSRESADRGVVHLFPVGEQP